MAEDEEEMSVPMRRKERAMSLNEAEKLLEEAQVGRLGVSWRDEPYVVPLNFVYYKGKVYFHSAREGKKLECLIHNPQVCFEVSDLLGIREAEKPCNFGAYYRSALVFGEARIVEASEKTDILQLLFEKYAKGSVKPVFEEKEVERVTVVEIAVKKITGKQRLP